MKALKVFTALAALCTLAGTAALVDRRRRARLWYDG